jgi:hypothetical protein
MSMGLYEETLPCGGKLKVTKNSWEIFYYFPGPDLRHNGEILSIPAKLVDQYITALNENWIEYDKLKESIPSGGEFSKDAKMGMSIRIGDFIHGVCILSYHMPISTKKQLEEVINGYIYAVNRAPQIQTFLGTLVRSKTTIEKNEDSDKTFQDLLFEARREWVAGDHSKDNLWALWKFDQAKGMNNPNCGTFEYWFSISNGGSRIESMVSWAEKALRS